MVTSTESLQPPGTAAPTLVGRERERTHLRDHLAAAMDGREQVVLIGGEAGNGKTTLAALIGREAAARGALVLTGHCYDLIATPPYGLWLDLVAGYHLGRFRSLFPVEQVDEVREGYDAAQICMNGQSCVTGVPNHTKPI